MPAESETASAAAIPEQAGKESHAPVKAAAATENAFSAIQTVIASSVQQVASSSESAASAAATAEKADIISLIQAVLAESDKAEKQGHAPVNPRPSTRNPC